MLKKRKPKGNSPTFANIKKKFTEKSKKRINLPLISHCASDYRSLYLHSYLHIVTCLFRRLFFSCVLWNQCITASLNFNSFLVTLLHFIDTSWNTDFVAGIESTTKHTRIRIYINTKVNKITKKRPSLRKKRTNIQKNAVTTFLSHLFLPSPQLYLTLFHSILTPPYR